VLLTSFETVLHTSSGDLFQTHIRFPLGSAREVNRVAGFIFSSTVRRMNSSLLVNVCNCRSHRIAVFAIVLNLLSLVNVHAEWTHETILEALVAERIKLRSGVATMTGYESSRGTTIVFEYDKSDWSGSEIERTSSDPYSGPVPAKLKFAFDFSKGLYLVDHTGIFRPSVSPISPRPAAKSSPDRKAAVGWRTLFFRSNEATYLYSGGGSIKRGHLYYSEREEDRDRWRSAVPDIRIISMRSPGYWFNRTAFDVNAIPVPFSTRLDAKIRMDEESQELHLWQSNNSDYLNRYIIDVENGFSVTKIVMERKDLFERDQELAPIQEITCKWDVVNGVHVPVHYKCTGKALSSGRHSEDEKFLRTRVGWQFREAEFDIVWDSVNEEIDPEYFDREQWELEYGTPVMASHGNGYRQVASIGRTQQGADAFPQPEAKKSLRRVLLLGLITSFLVFLVVSLWIKKKGRIMGSSND